MDSAREGRRLKVNDLSAAIAASCAMIGLISDGGWWSKALFDSHLWQWRLLKSFLVIIGANIGQVTANVLGRRKTLLWTWFFVIFRMVTISMTLTETWSNAISCVQSVGEGITYVVVPLYISEMADTYTRANLMVMPLTSRLLGSFVFSAIWRLLDIFEVDSSAGLIYFFTQLGIMLLLAFISSKTVEAYPDTPHYLNWKQANGEPAESVTIIDDNIHVTLGQDSTNPHGNPCVNNGRQTWHQKIIEIFSSEYPRNLVIIFSLIIISKVVGREKDDMILDTIIRKETSTGSQFENAHLGTQFAELFVSIVVMFTIRTLKRKLSVLLIILVCFITAIIGATSDTIFSWSVATILSVQKIGYLIVEGVTLAYAGECFPISKRASAFAAITICEVNLRYLFWVCEAFRFFSTSLNDGEHIQPLHYMTRHSNINCATCVMAFLVVLIFYPTSRKIPSFPDQNQI